MKTTEPLPTQSINHLLKLKSKINLEQQHIEDRLDYVIRTILNSCGSKLNYWYVDGAAEGEVGDLHGVLRADSINMWALRINHSPNKHNKDNFNAILEDKKWHLLEYAPSRWLFENFEDELKEGIDLYHNLSKMKKEAATKRRITNKRLKEALIQSARSKLTLEEQKAVGIFKKD